MTHESAPRPDPTLDLVLERWVDVTPERVWAAWTEPEYLVRWFAPAPWTVSDCTIDLRPGGRFRTVMRSPEGEDHPGEGCFLDIVPQRRLVWTAALRAGYRPQGSDQAGPGLPFTAFILLEPEGTGTRYTAVTLHGTPSDRDRHAAMGFEEGWGKALDQLVVVMQGTAGDHA